jgi:hypothetical protein
MHMRAWTDSPSGAGMGSIRVGVEADKELTRLQDLVFVAKRVLSADDGNASLPDDDGSTGSGPAAPDRTPQRTPGLDHGRLAR